MAAPNAPPGLPPAAPPPPTPFAIPCVGSILRGGVLGAVAGAGFHLISGTALRAAGRTTLTNAVVQREAISAAVRLGGVVALFAAVRCGTQELTASKLLPSMLAGAAAVAVPTAAIPERQAFLRSYYSSVLGLPKNRVSMGLIIGSSAASGALTLGLADYGLRWAGVDW